MGYESGTHKTTFIAGEAISIHRALYMKSADGLVYMADSEAVIVCGTSSETAAASGDPIAVSLPVPIHKVECGGTMTKGKLGCCTTDGRILNTTDTQDGDNSAYLALETGATGQYIAALPLNLTPSDQSLVNTA